MILKDKFYQLNNLQQEAGQLVADIVLNAADSIFEGHFPGNPVTPGVAQLEIVKELLSLHYKRPIQLKSISNCKYLAIMNPVETPEIMVKLSVTEQEDELKVNVVFTGGETIFTKVSGVYY
ncbi:3-hydroxyacyl-ACP dehydratase [Crocinitomicaceae bacterium CZZ-1]|uniref:3-hydroxyacyl-ACP dehydratase n=1 Tax=Taishania pollutisoli TaxID=2766479 RepID=A0A8J6PFB9_9FLAO|nr:3-hydroxyacyl-ACP dehydratase [Taishania pollutisoli]MBC9813438.1 3-hydroxyacyl-ACP dehydratase [Taishania pollutisoli]MBX2950675.1 3-hydroxyacyl-ACP dehydratase [Crocinitomicaceae bacterium]NGF76522.1 3-hydroxyacyl-ACP dehydratase [Fluviicola sp. SGL-29]